MSSKFTDTSTHPYGAAFQNLTDRLGLLPGIGRKSAERLAHYILSSSGNEALQLADAIREVKSAIHSCSQCFNLTDGEICEICRDPRRQRNELCIVEQPRDVTALEAANAYRGLYHVLQGRIAPLDGMGPEDLTIDALMRRVRNDGIEEIVMATNPTLEGDGTALYISNLLESEPVTITRLARGVASGSVLEFANKEMLADAMRGRQKF